MFRDGARTAMKTSRPGGLSPRFFFFRFFRPHLWRRLEESPYFLARGGRSRRHSYTNMKPPVAPVTATVHLQIQLNTLTPHLQNLLVELLIG